jgi:hypothetical protein
VVVVAEDLTRFLEFGTQAVQGGGLYFELSVIHVFLPTRPEGAGIRDNQFRPEWPDLPRNSQDQFNPFSAAALTSGSYLS